MAHFAQIHNGIVTQVLYLDNSLCAGGDFPQSEAAGQAYFASLGLSGEWKQTSYNKTFRVNYAVVGGTYDSNRDAFVMRQPQPSWILNESTLHYEAPIPYPNDGKPYYWDEDSTSWVEFVA